jgi:hypothetical protein
MEYASLIPVITGVVSATIQIANAIHSWWRAKQDQKAQAVAVDVARPVSSAAKDLHSLLDVQTAYWRTNPGMWQALGQNAARSCHVFHVLIVEEVHNAYANSKGYVSQIAQFAASLPDRLDWKASSTGLLDVSSKLKSVFAMHLGRVIAKVS